MIKYDQIWSQIARSVKILNSEMLTDLTDLTQKTGESVLAGDRLQPMAARSWQLWRWQVWTEALHVALFWLPGAFGVLAWRKSNLEKKKQTSDASRVWSGFKMIQDFLWIVFAEKRGETKVLSHCGHHRSWFSMMKHSAWSSAPTSTSRSTFRSSSDMIFMSFLGKFRGLFGCRIYGPWMIFGGQAMDDAMDDLMTVVDNHGSLVMSPFFTSPNHDRYMVY